MRGDHAEGERGRRKGVRRLRRLEGRRGRKEPPRDGGQRRAAGVLFIRFSWIFEI